MLDVEVKWDDLGNLHVSDDEGGSSSRTNKITKKICVQPRTQTSSRSKLCSISRRVWFWFTKVRSTGYLPLNGIQLHGWHRLCYMTEQSSCRKQRYMSTLIPCFCLGKIHEHRASTQKWLVARWIKLQKMCFELYRSQGSRTQIPKGTLVFPRTRNWIKVVWNAHVCARRAVEPLCRNNDVYPRRKRTSVFRATSALVRGFLKSKKGGKLSLHYNGDLSNAELLFRTIISANQISVNGAIADRCGELAQQISDHAFSTTGKPVAQINEQLECELSPEVVTVITKPLEIDFPAQGNLLRSHNKEIR